MNVSEVMVKYLAAAGVGHIFGYPGDPNVEFMESARRAGMQFVLGRREGTAGLMAEACGFLTGRPGVCMSTLGPGSSNLVNAVANAWLDRVPMIAISGQIERKREQTFTHQVLDHNRIFSSKATMAPDTVGIVMQSAAAWRASRPAYHRTDAVSARWRHDDVIALPPPAPASPLQIIAADHAAADIQRVRAARRPQYCRHRRAAARAHGARVWPKRWACRWSWRRWLGRPQDHLQYAGTLDVQRWYGIFQGPRPGSLSVSMRCVDRPGSSQSPRTSTRRSTPTRSILRCRTVGDIPRSCITAAWKARRNGRGPSSAAARHGVRVLRGPPRQLN